VWHVPSGGAVLAAAFAVGFVDAGGSERRVSLAVAGGLRLEDCQPVRSFPSFKGQRNFPRLWWSATMGRHVGFESWLERDQAMLLDFDPQVVGFAPQPLWLWWRAATGRERAHAPDWFARLADGSGVVVDCRPADRVRQRDAEAFAATEQACAKVGWRYQLDHAHDPVLVGNVRWLAGYRHPRHHDPAVAAALLGVFRQPRGLLAGAVRWATRSGCCRCATTCCGDTSWPST
jgi:hypothetical protein